MMTTGYNPRNSATKRLMKEYNELKNSPSYQYSAAPLEDNLFDWHFTIRGPEDSEFQEGIYHGRILLPPQYPFKPPSIFFFTPNGRFEVGKKICLSITGYHPESWQPAWGIRTALIAVISFMTTEGKDAIGALDYTPEERKILAEKSQKWYCEQCKCKNCDQVLPIPTQENMDINDQKMKDQKESKELAKMLTMSYKKQESSSNEIKENEHHDHSHDLKETQINQSEQSNLIGNVTLPNPSPNPTPNINPLLNPNTTQTPTPTTNNNVQIGITEESIQNRIKLQNNNNNNNISNSSMNTSAATETATASSSANLLSSSTSSKASSSMAASPLTTKSPTPTMNRTNSIVNRSSSQTNLNNNRNNDERLKSLIDTAIIITFSLLVLLVYNRLFRESKLFD